MLKSQAIYAELVAAIRSELKAELMATLDDDQPVPVRAKPGPKPKSPTPSKPAHRPKGARRDPAEIEKLTRDLVAYLKKNPGSGSEAIAKEMAIDTKDLVLPIQALVKAKVLRTVGVKRGTKYSLR